MATVGECHAAWGETKYAVGARCCAMVIALAIFFLGLLLALPVSAQGRPGTQQPGGGAAPAAAIPLVFGVYPYLSPSQIVVQFTPLAKYLGEQLHRPVELRSAPDFGSFIARTQQGEYDVIFTAPHMGRLAEQRDAYQPLAQTGYQITIVALTRKESRIRRLADLRGGTLAVGAKLSMSYQIVNDALRQEGLTLGEDVKFIDTASFSNVAQTLLRGEADAGATGSLLWDKADAVQKSALREIFRSPPVPGFLLLARRDMPAPAVQQVHRALLAFKDAPAGKDFFNATQQLDFRPLDTATLKRIDPYTAVLNTLPP